MSKTVISPSSRWPGQVSLSSPMTLPQAIAWERAILVTKSLGGEILSITEMHNALLPGVLACVEKWELEGIGNPPNPFPASPRRASRDLMTWLINEIAAEYKGEEEKADPNE